MGRSIRRYVLLHGAIRNAGDFLIFERARELLRHLGAAEEFVEVGRWEPLEPIMDIVNSSRAVVLCGGPGYDTMFYPGVFRLARDLRQVHVPIVPLGLGWSGRPSGRPQDFRFSRESLEALSEVHSRIAASSVRDVVTEALLRRYGIGNVVMTGCPAWYHLPHVERDFAKPQRVRRLVVTTPARPRNLPAAVKLLYEMKRLFAKAERFLVFHRGIWPGRNSRMREGIMNTSLAAVGQALGYRVVDASYSARKLLFYSRCDLHVGFRVHAHIAFLSFRRPSILIQEDGRGVGQSRTLGTTDVLANGSGTAERAVELLKMHLEEGFQQFHSIVATMKDRFATMQEFIRTVS